MIIVVMLFDSSKKDHKKNILLRDHVRRVFGNILYEELATIFTN